MESVDQTTENGSNLLLAETTEQIESLQKFTTLAAVMRLNQGHVTKVTVEKTCTSIQITSYNGQKIAFLYYCVLGDIRVSVFNEVGITVGLSYIGTRSPLYLMLIDEMETMVQELKNREKVTETPQPGVNAAIIARILFQVLRSRQPQRRDIQ